MSKQRSKSQKKRRQKQYRGDDAAMSSPRVTRVKAVQKSKSREWWEDNKRKVQVFAILTGLVFLIYFLLNALLRWIF